MTLYLILLITALIGLPVVSYAQTPTDAGVLLQQVEQERQKMQQHREETVSKTETAPKEESAQSELKVTVKSFRFEGNTLLSNKKLSAVVRRYLNHSVTYAQLQDAAAAVGEAYRKRGWAVRSFLPKQYIVDGVVVIRIVEASFGKVQIEEGSYGWPKQSKVEAIMSAQQKKGQALNTRKLDRGLLLLDDLPGVTASGRLQEGDENGQTDLVIRQEKEALFSGIVIADNEGSRSTGYYRAHSFMQLANPLRMGDQTTAYILYSEGLRFGRLEETLPVGEDGLRVGANASFVRYQVLPSEFESLNANGDSTSFGGQASYPLIRARQQNLYFNFNYDHKIFGNDAQGGISSEYCVDDYTATLRGETSDKFAGGGNTQASFSTVLGRLNLHTIQSGEDAALSGRFQKMLYSLARQQALIPKWSVYSSFSGQVSPDAKLDSSEKFYLGGPDGVRAYPISEGSGTEGYLSKTELRYRIAAKYQISGFYDYGRVKNQGSIQSYSLKGSGMELVWQPKAGLSVKFTWARRLGHNPNPTASGNDQDGSFMKDRFWLTMSLQF